MHTASDALLVAGVGFADQTSPHKKVSHPLDDQITRTHDTLRDTHPPRQSELQNNASCLVALVSHPATLTTSTVPRNDWCFHLSGIQPHTLDTYEGDQDQCPEQPTPRVHPRKAEAKHNWEPSLGEEIDVHRPVPTTVDSMGTVRVRVILAGHGEKAHRKEVQQH